MTALADALDRPPLTFTLPDLRGKTVAVTGGHGTIGRTVAKPIADGGGFVRPLDLTLFDVTSYPQVWRELQGVDLVVHLAADKHAPQAEEEPYRVAMLNIEGTHHVAQVCAARDVPFVVASTCKAADPCTAYGASKLIAEKIALNAGGHVVRLVNVLGSSGSVIPLWERVPDDEPLPVADCDRMWMTRQEAAGALLCALRHEPGRYAPAVGLPEPVVELARRVHPADRECITIRPRRGDRQVERLMGEGETAELLEGDPLFRIRDPWGFG